MSLGPLEASARILEGVRALEAESLPLEGAAGRVLAAPVHAGATLPPWDNAGMDGYAVHAAPRAGCASPAPSPRGSSPTVRCGPARRCGS